VQAFLRKYQIILFFVLTLIIGWFPWYAAKGGLIFAAPLLAGLLVAFLASGWEGVLSVLRRIARWRSKAGWYLLVIISPAILYLLAVGAHTAAGGSSPGFPMFKENQGLLALTFIFFLLPWQSSAFLEEVGFRGYALEELQERFGPLIGTLILGVFFGGWLLPEFLREGTAQAAMGGMVFFPWFVLQETGWSYLITYVYNRTRKSALIAGYLFHAAFNFWSMVLLTNAMPGTEFEAFDVNLFVLSSIVVALAALILVLTTKGRLGYSEQIRGAAK
jgi:membrane protease YdiL (CAAX protease family)